MSWIVDYPLVLDQMKSQHLRCLYPNSGAFGFDPAHTSETRTIAWIGPPDDTIRPESAANLRLIPPPFERNLAQFASQAWQMHFPGRAWIMPMSHWAYELEFGSRDWLPAVLENAGVDPGLLKTRNTGAAIEFAMDDAASFKHVLQCLLEMLLGSDFMIAFPDRPILCTIHHHQQLWWTTPDPALADALSSIVSEK